jgi:hypothetical protein
LVIAGGKSPNYMRNASEAIAAQIPDSETAVLDAQTHEVKAEVIAPVLTRALPSMTGEHKSADSALDTAGTLAP